MPRDSGTKTIATNRSARRDFEVLETVEAGIALKGSEVKSLRASHVQFADANVWIRDGEAFLLGVRVQPWDTASGVFGHDPDRQRKLLLHKDEIERLGHRVQAERLALVPLSLYFKDGRVKVEVALARGRKNVDKRHAIAKRDAELDARRELARRTSGKTV
jgi:SsrA-binding protein